MDEEDEKKPVTTLEEEPEQPDPSTEESEEEDPAQGAAEDDEPSQSGEEDPGDDDQPVSTGSPRLDKRIEKFTLKLKSEFARNQAQRSRQPSEPYQPANLEDMEYDPETLEALKKDREAYGRSEAQRAAREATSAYRQEMFLDRMEIDADRVAGKYAQLNEDSDDFDPDLTATINEMYLATTGYDERTGLFHNPVIRYKDYADAFMATIERATSGRSAESAKNVAKQAARQGVRPSGQARRSLGEVTAADVRKMSDKEFERNKTAIEAQIKRDLGI
jgi:hypothetical protein